MSLILFGSPCGHSDGLNDLGSRSLIFLELGKCRSERGVKLKVRALKLCMPPIDPLISSHIAVMKAMLVLTFYLLVGQP